MKRRVLFCFLFFAALFMTMPQASAISFDLDSIAAMGKFPRFIVNTYRWGDRFFNGYDTTYVKPTLYKFNVKTTADSWLDGYNFTLPSGGKIFMNSKPSTSLGVHATYLAVSLGYDLNVSKLFGNSDHSRKRFRFGFNCMLFAAEMYLIHNNGSSTIKRFGKYNHIKIPFYGVDNTTWGVDAYYFFRHKTYSEAATFNYSRIQKKSQGSFYTGLSIYTQKLNFDFNNIPKVLRDELPREWNNYYNINTHNYAIRVGYGYNWVFAPKWVLGVSESPVIGLRKGFVTTADSNTSFSLYNRMKLGVVWNSGRFFFGAVGKFDLAIVSDKTATYAGGMLSGEAVFGVRFNLW